MKTLQDLVDTLNKNFDNEFDLFDKENGFEFCLRVDGAPIIDFNSRDKSFEFRSFIEYVYGRSLSVIVNFLANSNSDNWLKEKKYNIIIGQDEDLKEKYFTVYRKEPTGYFATVDDALQKELKNDEYMFTENQVEELKSTLSENLAKIVDLGKVEIKDE